MPYDVRRWVYANYRPEMFMVFDGDYWKVLYEEKHFFMFDEIYCLIGDAFELETEEQEQENELLIL